MSLSSRCVSSMLLVAVALILALPGCKSDDNSTNGSNIVPVTDDLFPLTVGHKFTYDGYGTYPGTGTAIPDPTNSYKTVWTVAANGAPSPIGGTATVIIDSTTGPFGPAGFVVTVARNLLVRKDSLGDFYFMQSIGPFKRAVGIPTGTTAADTLIWVGIARPSQGVGSTGQRWTAYDQTFSSGGVTAQLQIFGQILDVETIVDSSGNSFPTYKSRTWRKVTVNGSVVADDATTSFIWLSKNIGPIQVRIVEDTENIGHWRTLKSKNF